MQAAFSSSFALSCTRPNGVPVKLVNVLRQPTHRYRWSPVAVRSQRANSAFPQCGQAPIASTFVRQVLDLTTVVQFTDSQRHLAQLGRSQPAECFNQPLELPLPHRQPTPSTRWPTCCQHGSVTDQKEKPQGAGLLAAFVLVGRGGGIRTRDPLLPKQMRYQAALRPSRMSERIPERMDFPG